MEPETEQMTVVFGLCENVIIFLLCNGAYMCVKHCVARSVGQTDDIGKGVCCFVESCMSWLRTFALLFVNPWMIMQAYLWLGAIAFRAIESEAEEAAHAAFVSKMDQYKANASAEVYTQLKEDLGDPDIYPWRHWDVGGSFFFCFTLVTTIGYGSFAPSTEQGKMFTILYSLFGIPLFGVVLAITGPAFLELTCGWAIRRRMRKLQALLDAGVKAGLDGDGDGKISASEMVVICDRRELRFLANTVNDLVNEVDDGDGWISEGELATLIGRIAKHYQAQLEFVASIVLFLLVVVLYPTLISLANTKYKTSDAVYFAWITATTIGLGDIVPNFETPQSKYGDSFFILYNFWFPITISLAGATISTAAQVLDRSLMHGCFLCFTSPFSKQKSMNRTRSLDQPQQQSQNSKSLEESQPPPTEGSNSEVDEVDIIVV